MSEPNKYREWILETIDSLRSRKARPDLERICRMVRRRHGSDPDRTRTELEKLIQEQTVLKVSYKGSISYRNAAKVQRKSRKKSEFTAAGSSGGSGGGSGGGSAEAARERTKHDHLNNNGDSAHSFTDQEEGEEDSEPSPDPHHTQTSASTSTKPKLASSSQSSGNGCLKCGATTGCDVGSGCKEEKASAPRDKGLGQQGAGDSPSRGLGPRTNAHDGGDAGRVTPSKADAVRGGKEPGLSGADTQNKTCSGSVSDLPQQQKQKQSAPLKPKLRVGGGGTKTAGNSDLGDRLVASVRSLSERSLRGGSSTSTSTSTSTSSAATRGHMKPLGLKEILGYLSSQERLSEEKLTRGKVKVVMEREVARGRLRRTRCGNITLPLRGMVVEEPMPKNASADRLGKNALQDKHTVKKPPSPPLQENEPMETASEEEEREDKEAEDDDEEEEEEEEAEEEEDPRSSDEERGLSPVAMTTEPELIEKTTEDAEIQTASKVESPHPQQPHGGQGMSGLDPNPRTPCSPVQGASLSQCNSAHSEEERAHQLHTGAQNQTQHDKLNHNSSGFNSLESKTEVGVSSCLLTPTASPRDSGMSEERGLNGGVSSGGFMKSEGVSGSPVDWTVSDVVSYFTAAGFPEQAAAFRTQEIDGKSLLLMQRNDVLTGLSIRLGPALKIYERHVKVLQKTHFEEDDC
ncbi:Atherin Sterile alpha motif domain-containing protein 1 [Larimichthys crocea]|uniref:Atherin Sterile alpha motif domain-containing protein 1 n=1 Tax=Larimichthys crocea TaxID=215358 RepID=A0A6G0JB93_LARCR|nr:Atherin Sterile alpha motif domain-containing protein 1 [Larimichthys crocea]